MSRSFLILASVGLLSTAGSVCAISKAEAAAATLSQNGAAAQPRANNHSIRTASALEIVKLKTAGLDPAVIKAYITTVRTPYIATAEDLLFLHEHKVPDELVVAWINRGSELVNASIQARNAAVAAQNAQPPVAEPAAASLSNSTGLCPNRSRV